ncbi:unnamed protein product [Amoebophrya sp. A120]|nr:unnamed protein product [Amoebophrya sp. A120]|eukprot:GSA120T00010073001.1
MSRHSRHIPSWLVSLPFALRHELLWSRQLVAAQDDRVVVEPKTGSAPPEQQAGGAGSAPEPQPEKLVLVDAGAEAKKRAECDQAGFTNDATGECISQGYDTVFDTAHGSNRNAASHLWVTYLTNKFRDETIESAEVYLRQMTNFCPVSGSPLTNGGMQLQWTAPATGSAGSSSSTYGIQPAASGVTVPGGYSHHCCVPCVCDMNTHVRVDEWTPKNKDNVALLKNHGTVKDKEAAGTVYALVIRDPCAANKNDSAKAKLAKLTGGPAPAIICDGEKLKAGEVETSDNGFVVIGLYYTQAAGQSETAEAAMPQTECAARSSAGCAQSGMGAIFIQAACLGFAPDASGAATAQRRKATGSDSFWSMPDECANQLKDECFNDHSSSFLEKMDLEKLNLAAYEFAGRMHKAFQSHITHAAAVIRGTSFMQSKDKIAAKLGEASSLLDGNRQLLREHRVSKPNANHFPGKILPAVKKTSKTSSSSTQNSDGSSNLADDEKSEFLRARQLGIKSSSSSRASSTRHSAWMLFLQKIAFGTNKLTTTARRSRSLTKSTTSGDNDSSSKDNDNVDKPIYHHTLVYSIPTNCDKSLPPSATREEKELCFNKFVEETLKPTLEQQLLFTTDESEKKQNDLEKIFPPELAGRDNTKNKKTTNNLSLRVLKLGETIMFTAEREEKELFMTEVGKNDEEGSTSSNTADDLENTVLMLFFVLAVGFSLYFLLKRRFANLISGGEGASKNYIFGASSSSSSSAAGYGVDDKTSSAGAGNKSPSLSSKSTSSGESTAPIAKSMVTGRNGGTKREVLAGKKHLGGPGDQEAAVIGNTNVVQRSETQRIGGAESKNRL